MDIEKLKEEHEKRIKDLESSENFLHYDFQGWPVFKKTLRELLEGLGAETFEMEGKEVFGFLAGEPFLDKYPICLEDDGMAYGVNEMSFSDANIAEDKDGNKMILFWRDEKYNDNEDEDIYSSPKLD